jgi:predicted O-methyltransferase YrrM
LEITAEFPATRGWAASPDFLRELIHIIRRHSPQQIVEAGSGVSTLVSALALKKYGSGQITALEDEKGFANQTREYLRLHGVVDTANVVHAPLTKNKVDGEVVTWYDTKRIANIRSIDLLIIDGPPAFRNEEARWPALPLLEDRLEPEARILVDDGDREGEKQIVKDWCQRFEFESTYLPLEEGAYRLGRLK